MGNFGDFLKEKYNVEQLHAVYEDGRTRPLRNIAAITNDHGCIEGIIIWKNDDTSFTVEVLSRTFFVKAHYDSIDKLMEGIKHAVDNAQYIVVDYHDDEVIVDEPKIGLIKDASSNKVEAIDWDEEYTEYEESDDEDDEDIYFYVGRMITEDEFMQEIEKL
jgi:hypothetical protein